MMLLVSLLCFFGLIVICFTVLTRTAWVPTPVADIEKLLDKAKVGPQTHIIDLGCGDGRVLRLAAERGAMVVGYEINPFLWWRAWRQLRHIPRVSVRFGNLWGVHLDHYTVIYTYLSPIELLRLTQRFAHSLSPTARVISYKHPFGGIRPTYSLPEGFLYTARSFARIRGKTKRIKA